MTIDVQKLRLEGIYPQRQKPFFMQRVKLAGGIISTEQALKVAQVAKRYARGLVHLTTRGSIELHWLAETDLAPVAAQLASVGLVNRGACGGAVRGVVCGSLGAAGAPALEALARRIHRHFTGNPRFETLPKKFKIGIESDTVSGRHLIQDMGLVAAPSEDGRARFDVYAAGGLGREPVPGFLLAQAVAEESLLPLIETVARLYQENTPPPKRLKYFVRQIGPDAFRDLVFASPDVAQELPVAATLSASLVPSATNGRLEVPIFAGELAAERLAALADIAGRFGGGWLMITGDQNVVLHLSAISEMEAARQALSDAGLAPQGARDRVTFRVCPGDHECIMGLAPTREVAQAVVDAMGPAAQGLSWAISGCPNCCAQPQLSQAGVVATRLVAEAEGEARTPRFDLYGRGTGPFAEPVQQGLTRDELLEAVRLLG